METTRELAPIMPAHRSIYEGGFTDIVSYTALKGSDEDHAFEVLHENRDINSKLIQVFKGMFKNKMNNGKQKFNYKMN